MYIGRKTLLFKRIAAFLCFIDRLFIPLANNLNLTFKRTKK